MLPKVSSVVLVSLLPFFIEGVHALEATHTVAPRQTFSATSNPTDPSTFIFVHDFSTSLTSCTPQNVTWTYSGPFQHLELTATSTGVFQLPPPLTPLSLRPPPSITATDSPVRRAVPAGASQGTTVTIAANADPRTSAIPWDVNVPSGWYQILADIDAYVVQPDPFFVQPGSDESCLSTTTSSSTSGPSSSITPTSGSSTPTPFPAPLETVAPITATSKDTRVGVIAGVVAGAVVFMIIILMAYLWLRKRKTALDNPVGGKLGGARLTRGWGGLGSITSTRLDGRSRASRDQTPATRNLAHHLPTNSFGAGFADDELGNGNPTSFEEKFYPSPTPVSYTNNPFDDDEGGLALGNISPHGGRAIASSRSSLQQIGTSQPHLHSSSVDSFTYPQRSPSTQITPLDTSPSSSYPYSSTVSPLQAAEMERSHSAASSIPAVAPPQKAARRESSGSQSYSARKTTRKPVPVYDPSIPTSSNHTSSPSPIAYVPSPITPTVSSSPFTSIPQGHYSKRSLPDTSGSGLAHKSSFGPGGVEGKPMHYLIPDPLPNKD